MFWTNDFDHIKYVDIGLEHQLFSVLIYTTTDQEVSRVDSKVLSVCNSPE